MLLASRACLKPACRTLAGASQCPVGDARSSTRHLHPLQLGKLLLHGCIALQGSASDACRHAADPFGCLKAGMPVTAEVVGMQRLPSAFGMVCFPLVVPTAFAEPIALRLVSTSGYLSSKVFVGCMFLGGALSTWTLRSWKICDTERQEPAKPGRQTRIWLTPRRLFMNTRV